MCDKALWTPLAVRVVEAYKSEHQKERATGTERRYGREGGETRLGNKLYRDDTSLYTAERSEIVRLED